MEEKTVGIIVMGSSLLTFHHSSAPSHFDDQVRFELLVHKFSR